jgi:CarD family transcriptional regulator
VEGFEHYYVINVVRTGATAYIPVGKMDELGVRLVMSQDKMVQVFTTLRDAPRILETDYKRRQAKILEKLLTCRPVLVAEVIRDLSWRKKEKRLTQKDENLLARGMDLLVSEMALATDTGEFEAQETIDAVLEAGMTDTVDERESLLVNAAAPFTQDARLQQLLDQVR